MNGVEFIIIECLKRRKWENALQHLNQLLSNNNTWNEMDTEKFLTYLLWRSQCFFELNEHEACIRDCKKIMDLVPDEAPRNNFWFKARWRLIHSLMQLKAFGEAKRVVQQLIYLCRGFSQQECIKLQEWINIASEETNSSSNLDTPKNVEEKIIHCDLTSSNNYERSQNSYVLNNQNKNVQYKNYSCIFCNISFENLDKFRDHCLTQSHQQTAMSDEGRDWKKRPPPRGLTADMYNLCPSYGSDVVGNCKNGSQCIDAHGIEELNEWKERFEYRMMKLQRSNETFFYGKSYTELLLNKLVETLNPEMLIKETIDGVEEEIEGKLTETLESKISSKKWIFTLHTTKILKVVSLLYDSHRNHFALQRITSSKDEKMLLDDKPINTQEWTSRLDIEEGTQKLIHKVELTFCTKFYGTFRQTIVFDFGYEPHLIKNVCVDVVPVKDVEKLKEVHQELTLYSTERWEPNTAFIIPFISSVIVHSNSSREEELLSTYFVPTKQIFTITQSLLKEDYVTINNYRSRMHELLYIEEMACYDQISKYSICAKLLILSSYILSSNVFGSSTAKFSSGNELFAMIKLNDDLSEDSPGGRLILNNCITVFLSQEETDKKYEKPKVYEALIEDKCKNIVYLRLSAQMVTDLKLKPDEEVSLEMQFQLNRIPFCEWHHAVDCISNYRIIFPLLLNIPKMPGIEEKEWFHDDINLNSRQKEAIVAITVPQNVSLPPVLIIGPFGTGKTYTLARAIKHILLDENSKILICTHSNSAADLYIKEYLHFYVQSGLSEARPLRIYYHKRWVSTVNSIVLEYCLTEVKNGTRIFKEPTLDDILKYRIIVVTLNISSHLSTIGLSKGYFSHILLDEAAQAIECEAIMPLALANERTRIVLAGDHMQLSPEVFSSFAKQKNFHVSLLQRLYESYPSDFPCKIVLCENYRAHKAIVKFTSSLFYDNKLVSLGDQPEHKKFYPLTFFTALGEDVRENNSTGYYNHAEVYELVERVAELKKDWPESWGKFNENSIGIMTPYPDQVYRIRVELKKRKMYGISVERVLNVQGKQFRAVFLSVVRTARTCVDERENEGISSYDYGFLSNQKLLNTAVTRAQSLVAVVGDPVSVCSTGRCRKIWEKFLKVCCKNNSFFGLTWDDLKSLLLAIEMKKKYKLNPLAPEFIPRVWLTEPCVNYIGAPLIRPPPGIRPLNGITAGSTSYSQNSRDSDNILTYDNSRYQLPSSNVSQSLYVQPSCSPVTQWNQAIGSPVVNSLNHRANATTSRFSTQPTAQLPTVFPHVPNSTNSLLYRQPVNPSTFNTCSNFLRLDTPVIPSVQTSVTENNIPIHLRFTPQPQNFHFNHPMFINYGNLIPQSYSYLPNNLNQNVNPAHYDNLSHRFNYAAGNPPCSSSVPNMNSISNIPTVSRNNNQQEAAGLEDILPPNVNLSEVLTNLELQKKWLSYLVECKRIQCAQKFLSIISLNLANNDLYRMQEPEVPMSSQNINPSEVNSDQTELKGMSPTKLDGVPNNIDDLLSALTMSRNETSN